MRSGVGHPLRRGLRFLALALALPATVDALLASGRLDERLAGRAGGDIILLPPLAARAEDLRPLVLDELGRLGLRLRGAPFGLSPGALALITEHDWPDNDAELLGVLQRAARLTDGALVTAAHLRAAGGPFALAERESRRTARRS